MGREVGLVEVNAWVGLGGIYLILATIKILFFKKELNGTGQETKLSVTF